MKEFKGESLIKFPKQFSDDSACKAYLSDIKRNDGFKCKKCGNNRATVRRNHIRTCTICRHNESLTAHTAFHRVTFGIQKAFFITFEMVNSTKNLSASQIAKRYEISRKTAWLFMHKIRRVMKSSEQYPMDGIVQVDEFTIGGKEMGNKGEAMI